MKIRIIPLLCLCILFPFTGLTQTSRILSWQQTDDSIGKLVYHPEPILFVHGINNNDEGWEHYGIFNMFDGVLPQLAPEFQKYWIPQTALNRISTDRNGNRQHATQRNYLHTFNYGDYQIRNCFGASARSAALFDRRMTQKSHARIFAERGGESSAEFAHIQAWERASGGC